MPIRNSEALGSIPTLWCSCSNARRFRTSLLELRLRLQAKVRFTLHKFLRARLHHMVRIRMVRLRLLTTDLPATLLLSTMIGTARDIQLARTMAIRMVVGPNSSNSNTDIMISLEAKDTITNERKAALCSGMYQRLTAHSFVPRGEAALITVVATQKDVREGNLQAHH